MSEQEKNERGRTLCILCGSPIDWKVHEGRVYWKDGNNAQPLADGRCCDLCDCILVIPTRMGGVMPADLLQMAMGLYRQRMSHYKLHGLTTEEE